MDFGRKVVKMGGIRVLQCRCDAAKLTLPLPAPFKGSFCQLCDIKSFRGTEGKREETHDAGKSITVPLA